MSEITDQVYEKEALEHHGFVFHIWKNTQKQTFVDVYYHGYAVGWGRGGTTVEVWDSALTEARKYLDRIKTSVSLDELIGSYRHA